MLMGNKELGRLESFLARHRAVLERANSINMDALKSVNREKATDAKARAQGQLAEAEAAGDATLSAALRRLIRALERMEDE
jgi:hypothetical protein